MQKTLDGDLIVEAKPFLKWAGGKGQLIPEIEKRLPVEIKKTRTVEKYFEPFIGGGALFFYLMSNYKIKKSYISDINKELTSLSSGAGKYNPIPFLRDSFYLDDTFPKDDNPRNRMNIRIEMYSYEDIYELASGRNKVFFRLLQNEFGFEEENSK